LRVARVSSHVYDTVLVPTDGSDPARAASDRAVDLAARYDATVHALFVVDVANLGLRTPTDVDVGRLDPSLRDHGEAATAAVAASAAEAGVRSVTALRVGVPHRTILDYVDDHDVDLVVMGTHGRRGVTRLVLGSVTERVVRLSPCPVLVDHRADGDQRTQA
jgi:nucleotide-binding universal stress UspA family protein